MNPQDAEEVVQDVFIKFWNNKKSLNIDSNVNAFLYAITRNACLDYLKARKRKSEKDALLIRELQIRQYVLEDETSGDLIKNELQTQINSILENLPLKCRRVFIKSRYEGKKHKEISKELNISEKTVENHISRALKEMRLQLRGFLSLL